MAIQPAPNPVTPNSVTADALTPTPVPPNKGHRGLGLQATLVSAILIAVSATAGIVHVSWLMVSRRNLESIVTQVHGATTRSTLQAVADIFARVESAGKLVRLELTEELINSDNPQALAQFYLRMSQAYPNFAWLELGRQNGDYLGVQRESDTRINLIQRDWNPETQKAQKIIDRYVIEGNTLRWLGREIQTETYYAPQRPWYQVALAEPGKLAWTDAYVFRTSRTAGINASLALMQQDQVIGVVSIAFELKQIGRYLQELAAQNKLTVVLINSKGELIATSIVKEEPYTINGSDTLKLKRLQEATEPALQLINQILTNQNLTIAQVDRSQQVSDRDPTTGERYYLAIAPLGLLDWRVVTLIPESNYLGEVNAAITNATLQLSVVTFLLAVVMSLLTSHWISKPILRLSAASEAIAAGDLDQTVALPKIKELKTLANSFNRMAQQLKDSFVQLEKANTELEDRVAARTAELSDALIELQKMQAQLIQNEKMSSLGQLVAGVAHEINNPVNFIHGNLLHAQEYAEDLLRTIDLYQTANPNLDGQTQTELDAIDLDFIKGDFPKLLSSMNVGTERIHNIVKSLRHFSRVDEAEFKEADIHEGLDSTLMILHNRLKARPEHPGINVIKDYADLPKIECYAGQLNQVFMNILTNAIDALEAYARTSTEEQQQTDPPTIWIKTQQLNADWVSIHIINNGPPIPAEIQSRLFDPFFTTKPIGQGTGLGLSISYQIIVDKHKGRLKCESQPGRDTAFIIEIPTRQGNPPATSASLSS
ncbi:ATP-binding protein [Trichothermofontia sichuanensis B231]|uniref:sensor histidine kinase n=1 Tax=Trichothermofontia sichuanensis TaxID=3045816 RepID=UPI002247479B|nr:ATP-binding protein [Trichothermofontia sichuanensis]UZQ55165.1 ATP-binding protein [Trichothermofontia sichuanensis B231]